MAPLWLAVFLLGSQPSGGGASPDTPAKSDRPFPRVEDVLGGRSFENSFDREAFFLKRIREDYNEHWASLLGANIEVNDYVHAPDKLLRFVQELGSVAVGTDDWVASTNLALIVSDPLFYANTNAYRPGILREAAWVLIRIGPRGRECLAKAFNEPHYRADSGSLEVLADAIGRTATADTNVAAGLTATAFDFATVGGGFYPRCTTVCISNLMRLPGGEKMVADRSKEAQALIDPGRYQAVLDGISGISAQELGIRLGAISTAVSLKLNTLTNSPGDYRDALSKLQASLKRALKKGQQ